MTDVARFNAEVGYWLGEGFWGRGFAAEALRSFTLYVFESFPVERLEAWVFATNPASERVLEKAGYEYEATLRRSAFKDGHFLDCNLYVRFRPRPLLS
jgi:RimJ/RimL family protein N-acetyltransferase